MKGNNNIKNIHLICKKVGLCESIFNLKNEINTKSGERRAKL
ncbi:hypothetical protein J2Z72_000635 [Peptostreptococcus canis]|nr:hypothetical protein [Peptostreptococcus canis]